jgi:hypothetical protein
LRVLGVKMEHAVDNGRAALQGRVCGRFERIGLKARRSGALNRGFSGFNAILTKPLKEGLAYVFEKIRHRKLLLSGFF